jgi:FHA domain
VDEPLAVALKFGFLAVLYLFLLWIARSAMKDLRRSDDAPAQADPLDREPDGQPQLEVIAAKGHEPGSLFDLTGGAMMGRADTADIQVDDQFASSAHARIFPRDGLMYIEDMGSTNGTYLNGRQVGQAERLKLQDVIRIGDSEYRYQE